MSDIKLFQIQAGKVNELPGKASDLEKPLQILIEGNLEKLLGVRFLATEHSIGKTHAGRIYTLGMDEDNCAVVLEYKRSVGENVINQGLFYLDWLMDHKAEFELLVLKRYGDKVADAIDWTGPRLICVASDFTKYDGHAVQQMHRIIAASQHRLDPVQAVRRRSFASGTCQRDDAYLVDRKGRRRNEESTPQHCPYNAHEKQFVWGQNSCPVALVNV